MRFGDCAEMGDAVSFIQSAFLITDSFGTGNRFSWLALLRRIPFIGKPMCSIFQNLGF
jgi:hypothetical protein